MDSVRIQDIPVARIEWPDLVNAVEQAIAAREQRTISYVNVHVFNLAATHEKLRCFLQHVDICYCDGRGVQWAAWLLGDGLPQRMTGADWIEDLSAEAAQRGWRVAWIGGTPGVTQTAADRLQSRHPALQMVYTDHGYHPSDDLSLIERLNAAKPDILLVGMGSPLQEDWVAQHRAKLSAPVVWCLGATADYVSGKLKRGPTWLTKRHEWLARLVIEPRRLGRRYIIGNPAFFIRLLRQRITHG